MYRRAFLKSAALLGATFFLSKENFAGLPASGQLRMLSQHTGIYTEKGGTIAFLNTAEGIIVVDAQFPDTAPHFIEQVKEKSSLPFRYLFNTHHHFDHTSGNIAFKGLIKDVVAHKNSIANQLAVAQKQGNVEGILLPNLSFDKEGWRTQAGKSRIQAFYFGPAHTNGDSVIYFEKENLAHVGDLCFNRKHPYIDRSAGASIKGWITVIDKIKTAFPKNTQFVCGHCGEGSDVLIFHPDLTLFEDYLGNVMHYVSKGIQAGKSKEELLQCTQIPGSPLWQGEGIERPITAAFEELSGV